MERTWRWFGPKDPVTLSDAKQAGAFGIVSALHDIPDGEPWSVDEVIHRRDEIRAADLVWSVVESIPVSNEIKLRGPSWARDIENYKVSLQSVAAAGVRTVCYNFIPLVDWVRTDLAYPLRSGLALRFDMADFVACDVFLLKRRRAESDYSAELVQEAARRFASMDGPRRESLEAAVLAPLPGGTMSYSREAFFRTFSSYDGLKEADYLSNYIEFIKAVLPVAEELGITMTLHPDDPPINLFGLPRIAGTAPQLRAILSAQDSPSHGLCFCVGSLGVRPENDLAAMVKEFAPRIGFAHLRNVRRQESLSFFEDEHLRGSSDMVAVLDGLLTEERRRREAGSSRWEIPMRPDHGHLMLDDQKKPGTRAGYSAIGRLKGMAELNGAIAALEWRGVK